MSFELLSTTLMASLSSLFHGSGPALSSMQFYVAGDRLLQFRYPRSCNRIRHAVTYNFDILALAIGFDMLLRNLG